MSSLPVEGFRASPQQRRLWPAMRHGAELRVQGALTIRGQLELEVLRRALATRVEKHEILRTTFFLPPGLRTPLQVVGEDAAYELCQLAAEESLSQLLAAERSRPFHLRSGPLLRVAWVSHSPAHSWLVLTLPALCADRRSLDNLLVELAAELSGTSPVLAAAADQADNETLQYADFAAWLEQLVDDPDDDAVPLAAAFWQPLIDHEAAAAHLPGQGNAAAAGTFVPQRLTLEMQPALGQALDEWRGSTAGQQAVGDWVLVAWHTLLWRLTGTSVRVGEVVLGRTDAELDAMIGPLECCLPLACCPADTLSGSEFVDLCREARRQTDEWQDYADLDRLQECQFSFEETAAPVALASSRGLSCEWLASWSCGGLFTARLVCETAENQLQALRLFYDPRQLDEGQATVLGARLQRLLAALLRSPERRLTELELLGVPEQRRLMVDFQGAPVSARLLPLDRRLEALAAERPMAPALICGAQRLTYGELFGRVETLSERLRQQGVGPEDRVAIHAERSADLVVAIFAIFRAGAAYVVLEPGSPADRLAAAVADSRPRVLLTESAQPVLGESFEGAVLLLDDAASDPSPAAGPPPVNAGSALEQLAYVLFTSGSTGRPKGVAIEHRALASYVAAVISRLELQDGWRYAMVSTFAADLGHTMLYPALASGGCLHVISAEMAASPDTLADYMEAQEIDCLKIVPSHLKALLSMSRPGRVLPRRRLVLGGEALSRELPERLDELAARCRVFNHYGPTETTVGVLAGAASVRLEGAATVPLGRPLDGARAILLDRWGGAVAEGVVGEIHLGGSSLARCYWCRPAWTAERFVPDRWSGASGERLYRTGDLAKQVRDTSDGLVMAFVGRTDSQVKLRGFRIELGEVEAALRQLNEVRDAVAVIRRDVDTEVRLVAYVVFRQRRLQLIDGWRQTLAASLPDYMVPVAMVALDALPLTANGKVDRAALPAPERIRSLAENYVVPQGEAECLLAEVWEEVLGMERIGSEDNFFELGGDSILAIQVIARASRAGLTVDPRQIFQYQTIAELALVAVEGAGPVVAEQGLVAGMAPLTPIQQWFFAQGFEQPQHWNQSLMFDSPKPLEVGVLGAAISGLMDHHDALRSRFQISEERQQQIFERSAPEQGRVTHLDLSRLRAEEGSGQISSLAAQAQAALDLRCGPVLRAIYFEIGGEVGHRLLLVIHHLVIDGVSWRVLFEDLAALYGQLASGQAPSLPAKTTSYKSWAEKSVAHVAAGALDQELEFWRAARPLGSAGLPLDFPSGDNSLMSADGVVVELDADLTRSLLQEVPAAYGTEINDLLLSALLLTLSGGAGDRELLLEMEGHGREMVFADVDLSRTVGWFTTHYPVLLRGPVGADLGATLIAVKENLRQLPARGIGYGMLRYLRPADAVGEGLGAQPEPTLSFNYLGQLDSAVDQAAGFLQPAAEDTGPSSYVGSHRYRQLEISVMVIGGKLRSNWIFSKELHRRATIEGWAGDFLNHLKVLIEHCLSPAVGAHTPSDFPLAGLDQDSLEQISKLLGENDDLWEEAG